MLAVLFYGTSLFAQDKPFDIEHAPAPLFRCPIYDGPTDPTLEWNTERQEWWMFYTQRRANVPNLQEVACVYGSKVGIAATKNNGKNCIMSDSEPAGTHARTEHFLGSRCVQA